MPKTVLLLMIIIVAIFPASLIAQDSNEAYIYGYVKDDLTGEPISGVVVECIDESDSTQKISAVTDATGSYLIMINVISSVNPISDKDKIPLEFRLEQNYPNPFSAGGRSAFGGSPATNIRFYIPHTVQVRLDIFNILGQKVKILIDNKKNSGSYTVAWDGTDETGFGVPAGLYFYRMIAGNYSETKKMILIDGSTGGLNRFVPLFSPSESIDKPLLKSNNQTVTIRANSRRIQFFEQNNVQINSLYQRFDINATLIHASVFDENKITVSQPSSAGRVYVGGLAKAIVDTVIGTEKVMVTNERTQEDVSMRVDYDGGFPLMSLKGEIGDLLSLKLLHKGVQVGDTWNTTINSLEPPKVKSSNPTNGEKDIVIQARIFINFSDEMDTSTITERSFTLVNGGNIPGTICFLNDNTTACFTPREPLKPATKYSITITKEVKNLWGMLLDSVFTSSFTTGSDSLETRIAFHGGTTEPEDNGSIYTMNSNDGSDWRELTKRNNATDMAPYYSPDGTRIVFTRQINKPYLVLNDIYMMNWDGTYIEQITNTPESAEWGPSFSPDGQKIAYCARNASNSDDKWDIFVMDLNGRNLINLTNDIGYNYGPHWSPDGQQIVFVSSRDGEMNIFIMEKNGSNPKNITTDLSSDAWHPAWSPDGTQIAFYTGGWDAEIYLIDPDGSNLKFLTLGYMPTHGLHEISWSPDGKKLAYLAGNLTRGVAIAVINRDGTNQHLITYYDHWEIGFETPAWSPKNPK